MLGLPLSCSKQSSIVGFGRHRVRRGRPLLAGAVLFEHVVICVSGAAVLEIVVNAWLWFACLKLSSMFGFGVVMFDAVVFNIVVHDGCR